MNETIPFLSPSRARAVVMDDFGHRLASEASAPIRLYDSVSSTFVEAEALLGRNAMPEWGSVIAAEQTDGIGQYGRTWCSPQGNMYATLRLPRIPLFTSLAASPALGGMLASILNDLGLPIWLKWPNDLIVVTPRSQVTYRKVGGILIKDVENAIFAGIGLNVAAAPDDEAMRQEHAFSAGTLSIGTLTGHNIFSIVDLWVYLVAGLRHLFTDGIERNWRILTEARLLCRGDTVEVLEDGEGWMHTQGRLLGLDAGGGLRLLTENGKKVCTTGTVVLAKPRVKEID